MVEPIKLSIRVAIEVTIFALLVGVLAGYIVLSRQYVVMNENESARMVEMRESKELLEYAMLDYITDDDVIVFTSKFRDVIDIDIRQDGRIYRLEKYTGGRRWDIGEVRDFIDSSSAKRYTVELESVVGDSTTILKAHIGVY